MRSTLRNLLVVSCAIALPAAVGCSEQTDQNSSFGGDVGGAGGRPDDSSSFVTSVSTGFGSGVSMTPPGVWTKRYGDTADQMVGALAADEFGDIALTGSAKGTIDFGNIPWTGSTTDNDVFVAKLSSKGQSMWSRRYGDSCDQNGRAVALTPGGNVLITGEFCGKMDFGSTTVEAPAGEVDTFVAVIDDVGEDIYSRRIGGAGPQVARAAAVDLEGNAILVGSFEKAFDDGSGSGSMASAGLDDVFVIKLDPKGNVLWSQRFGGPEADIANAVAIDQTGNVIVGGSFGDSVDFGGGPIAAAPGHSSAFVMALDPDGKHLWSHGFGVDDEAVVNGLAVDPSSGKVAATGSFAGTIDFGSGPVLSAGAEDVFLILITEEGKTTSGRAFGGAKSQVGTGVAFGVNGDLAISATSQEPIAFDNGAMFPGAPPTTPELLYLAMFTPTGALFTQRSLGSFAPIQSAGIGIGGKLDLVLAGSFQQTFIQEMGSIESAGGWDVFVTHSE